MPPEKHFLSNNLFEVSKAYWHSVEIKPEICKGSSKIYFDWLIWKSMSELSDNIEKLGPAHAILRG